MNDPNGMVYFDGEYHLFYQYYPDSTVWGPMHWGHAVSKDMVTWEHLPIALYPDSLGYIFSGSAVVDWKNTTGFGNGTVPPLVAIFTHHQMEKEKAGATDYQYQSLAYSLDKGRTWTKYAGNPVLPNQGTKDFRDPKVFWYERDSKWVMVLAVADRVELYESMNLIDWSYLSEFGRTYGSHGGVWECPDLFALTAADGTEKWVLLLSINPGGPVGGSATQYFVGQFDGTTFTCDDAPSQSLWLDAGADNYAGVTWSDVPAADGRRLFLGWMSNWNYGQKVPTDRWRSAMTVPRELKLIATAQGYRVASAPVRELDVLAGEQVVLVPRRLVFGLDYLSKHSPTPFRFQADLLAPRQVMDFVITLGSEGPEKLHFGYSDADTTFFVDRMTAGINDFSSGFPARHTTKWKRTADTLELDVIVDRSSVEIFVNGGELVITELVFPERPFSNAQLDTRAYPILINGKITALKSIWNQP